MIAAALLAGLALIATGGVFAARGPTLVSGLRVQAAGACAVGIAGFAALASGRGVGSPFTSAFHPQFGVDPLSGLFLGALGTVAAPALLFATGYLAPGAGRDRAVAVLTAAFVICLVGVMCARDPVTLLGGWELMTLLPASIILVAHGEAGLARRSVFLYLAVTHIGGAGTWVAVLLLAKAGAIGGTAAVHAGSGLQAVIAVAALVGLGTKAGVVPLHVWLPRAHPIAPAPVSALMSGVMIKVPIYLSVRVLVDWDGRLPVWVGVVVVAVGAVSAIGGVVYALFEHELKRLLAMHSIENIGIIVLGLGACLLLRSRGAPGWAAFALAASLLHTVNHAVFKSLLFLSAGSFERLTGGLRMDQLGGLLRRVPVTGGAFLVGAAAIAGLPPLNGFASEWLTVQSLVHVSAYGKAVDGVVGAAALAGLAATAALAVFCFAKVVGLVLLGPPRREPSPASVLPTQAMGASAAFLAGVCVILGAAPGLLFGRLVGLAPWSAGAPTGAGLRLPGTGGLPTLWIAGTLVVLSVVLVRLRDGRSADVAPTWLCGQVPDARLSWTSAGFTKPLRLVLEPVLRPSRELTVEEESGVLQRVAYRGEVPHLIEERVYGPLSRWSLRAAAGARRLQSGSLSAYVGYLAGLVVVLLVVLRLGWLG